MEVLQICGTIRSIIRSRLALINPTDFKVKYSELY